MIKLIAGKEVDVKCANCQYFEEAKEEIYEQLAIYEICRFNPPTPCANNENVDSYYQQWASVDPETDWCGQHLCKNVEI